MSRRAIYAANWKMNMNKADICDFMKDILPVADSSAAEVLIFPPATYLNMVAEACCDHRIGVGSQNHYWENDGAFTGEISTGMVKDCGAKYAMVGHSERRHIFGESAEVVTRKARKAQSAGLIPLVCIGETLEEREGGETLDVLRSDVIASLAAVDPDPRVVVAYEPVWAIGTGLTCPPEQAEEAICYIRQQIRELWGDIADDIRILYGGSVKPDNIAELMACPNIDGGLIGGASLKADSFARIIKNGEGK